MTLEIEHDLEALLCTNGTATAESVRELIVLELYREHRISSGKSALLLAESRAEFLRRAATRGVPWFDMADDDFALEAAESNRLANELRL